MDGVACQYLCHIEMPKNRGNVFPAHYHYYIEMLYALSGQFQIYLNGIYHEFAKGDFVLINSREVHKIDAVSDNGGSYIVVRFLPELIYDGISQSHFELKYLLLTYILIQHNRDFAIHLVFHLLMFSKNNYLLYYCFH